MVMLQKMLYVCSNGWLKYEEQHKVQLFIAYSLQLNFFILLIFIKIVGI
jgi:hypothetical protein